MVKAASGYFEVLVSAVDEVLERRRSKRQRDDYEKIIRDTRDQAQLLSQEVNHRIANSLGLVAAMVRMQAATLSDPAAVQALQEAQTRITAVGCIHRSLSSAKQIGAVEMSDYFAQLVDELQDSLGAGRGSHAIRLTADRVTMATGRAVSLGIIVGELITNAFKYAYPEDQPGEIRIALSRCSAGRVRVEVEDDGVGFEPGAPARGSGLGTRFVGAMALNLGAEVHYGSGHIGSRVSVEFPNVGPA